MPKTKSTIAADTAQEIARRIKADLALIERNDGEVAAKTEQTREAWWRIFQALAEQRDTMLSNNAFAAWVKSSGLDQGLLRHNSVRSNAIWCWRNRGVLQCLNTEAVHPTALRAAYEFAYPKRWDSREKRSARQQEARSKFVRDKDERPEAWYQRAFPPALLTPLSVMRQAGEQQGWLATEAYDDMKFPRAFVARVKKLQAEGAAALAAVDEYLTSGRPLRRTPEEISAALLDERRVFLRAAAAQATLDIPDLWERHFDSAEFHDHPLIVAPEAWAAARAQVSAAMVRLRPAIEAQKKRRREKELRRLYPGFSYYLHMDEMEGSPRAND